MMNKILRLLVFLLICALFFGLGVYVEHKEVVRLENLLAEFVQSQSDHDKAETKHKLNILFAIKERDLKLVEGIFVSDLKQDLKYPMYTDPGKRDSLANSIYEQANRYQEKYCSEACLGVKP